MESVYDKIAARLQDGLGPDDFEWAAKELMKLAIEALPGASLKERIDWASAKVYELLESVDHLIPVAGPFMDLPFMDMGERFLVDEAFKLYVRPALSWAYSTNELEAALGLG
jgi:hypothetical protein